MSTLIQDEASHLVEYFQGLLRGDSIISSTTPNFASNEKPKSDVIKNGQIYKLVDSGKKNSNYEQKEELVSKTVNPTIEDVYVKAESYDDVVKASFQMSGTVVQMQDAFGVPVLNTLWRMMAGKR